MKRFAWLALATLALALTVPIEANAAPVPGGEVMAALAAVELPVELARPAVEAPFILDAPFSLEMPLSSSPDGLLSLWATTVAGLNNTNALSADAEPYDGKALSRRCGERPGGFKVLLEFRARGT